MLFQRTATVGAAFLAASLACAPAKAGEFFWGEFQWGAPLVMPHPTDYGDLSWYERYLVQRSNNSYTALYNRPCMARSGTREYVVSCRRLAEREAAIYNDGYGAPYSEVVRARY